MVDWKPFAVINRVITAPTYRPRHTGTRYGYLAYSRQDRRLAALLAEHPELPVLPEISVSILDSRCGELRDLPTEVILGGRAFVTALIHPISTERIGRYRIDHVPWPIESGGQAAYEQVMERLRWIRSNPSHRTCLPTLEPDDEESIDVFMVDYPLYQLLAPERQRIRSGMAKAIETVIKLVSADRR